MDHLSSHFWLIYTTCSSPDPFGASKWLQLLGAALAPQRRRVSGRKRRSLPQPGVSRSIPAPPRLHPFALPSETRTATGQRSQIKFECRETAGKRALSAFPQ